MVIKNKSKPYRFKLLPLLKGSPLHPFFNYNYNKLRQNGALFRFHLKWANKDNSLECEVNSLDPISIKKMGSLLLMLLGGMVLPTIIFMLEKICKTKRFRRLLQV